MLSEVVKHRFNGGISFEGDRDSGTEVYQRFLSNFRARYGQSEPEFSVLSQYDTVMFVAEALRAGMQSAVEIKQFITTKRDFRGILGATSFDPKGDAVHVAIPMRYKDGVCHEVE